MSQKVVEVLSENVVRVSELIEDLREVDPKIWVETVQNTIARVAPEMTNNEQDGSRVIPLGLAAKVVRIIARAKGYDPKHPAISHYLIYSEVESAKLRGMVGMEGNVGREIDGSCLIAQPDCHIYEERGDDWRGINPIEMDKINWMNAWRRLKRKNYTKEQLQAIIGETQEAATLIAASILWTDQQARLGLEVIVEDIFHLAAELALSCNLDDLWEAFYSVQKREDFVAVVMAILHYELLVLLAPGQYYPWIDVAYEQGEFVRKYPKRKAA
ncbi:MAG TPA: hypothetical protein VK184_07480 [Nostocaceae cyanobacterium]|nr:hypothetical protein [Nostocaceae cyanobacterium]